MLSVPLTEASNYKSALEAYSFFWFHDTRTDKNSLYVHVHSLSTPMQAGSMIILGLHNCMYICHSNPLLNILHAHVQCCTLLTVIDLRHRPDCTYKWIGHYMDHWSKFHILFALSRKSAAEVGYSLQNKVFAYLGTPRILHSDNGREFVNEIVQTLVKQWPGNTTIVNGRPRNSKCQGLVEQGNHTVEKLLGAHFNEHQDDDYPPWTEWLPFIQCKYSQIDCDTCVQNVHEQHTCTCTCI